MGRSGESRKIDDHRARVHMRFHRDGIAPSAFTDRGNVNRGSAIPANDVEAFLPVTHRAADLAGVESRRIIAVRFMNDQKANHRSIHIRAIEVQTRVRQIGKRDAHLIIAGDELRACTGAAMARA